MIGNTIWLELCAFQEELLPKPPTHLMPPPGTMVTLKKEFERMMKTHEEVAEKKKLRLEDTLAKEFVSLLAAFRIPDVHR